MADSKIRVTQIRSTAGRLKKHIACVHGLGLRRIGHSVPRSCSVLALGRFKGRDFVAHRPNRQQLTASAPLRSAALCALLRLPALPAP